MAGMTVTDERLESVDFSTSYATGIQSVIVKEGSDIKTIDDLAGKKIGVIEDYSLIHKIGNPIEINLFYDTQKKIYGIPEKNIT